MASQWRQRRWLQYDPLNLLTTVLGGPVAAPFAQTSWPNPQQPRRPVQADCQSSLLVGPLAVPFAMTEWPLPQLPRYPQWNLGFTKPANVQLIGQDQFFAAAGQAPVYDYPNPLRPRYPVQPEPPPNLLTTTFTIVVMPFYQVDWPLPQQPRQPAENRSFTRGANTQLIGQDLFFGARGQAPVYDWPNPVRPRYLVHPEALPNLLVTVFVVTAAPFSQRDWPNPQVALQPQENRGFTRGANTQLIGLDKFPFALRDWPNPLLPKQPQENRGFVRAANVQLIGMDQLPFIQTEWPNPQIPRQPQENKGFVSGAFAQIIPPPIFVRPDYIWTEATRGIVWVETTRSVVWTKGGQVLTLVSRTQESAVYAYDFSNDAAILAGDTLSSVVSVTAMAQNQVALAGALPTLGTATVVGKRVLLVITAPTGPVGIGAQFGMRFIILTAGGLVRVGLGTYVVSDQG